MRNTQKGYKYHLIYMINITLYTFSPKIRSMVNGSLFQIEGKALGTYSESMTQWGMPINVFFDPVIGRLQIQK